VTYYDLLEDAIEALKALSRGNCWCEMAIGNPLVNHHSGACERVRGVIERYDKSDAQMAEYDLLDEMDLEDMAEGETA
jgi:hypothetical protein